MDSTGAVLYDSRRDAAQLAGHADRPEVASAMATGQGEARRMSANAGHTDFYYAQRLPDGRIFAFAGDMQSVMCGVAMCALPRAGGAAVALIAGLAAGQETRRIVAPLEHLDLEHPLHNAVYPETVRALAAHRPSKQPAQRAPRSPAAGPAGAFGRHGQYARGAHTLWPRRVCVVHDRRPAEYWKWTPRQPWVSIS